MPFLQKIAVKDHQGALKDLEAGLKIKQNDAIKNQAEIGKSYFAMIAVGIDGKINFS